MPSLFEPFNDLHRLRFTDCSSNFDNPTKQCVMTFFGALLICALIGQSSSLIFGGQTFNIQIRIFIPAPVPVTRFFRSAGDLGSEIGKSVVDMAMLSGILTSANSLLQLGISGNGHESSLIDTNTIASYFSDVDLNGVSNYLGFGDRCTEKMLCEVQQELDSSDDIISSSLLLAFLSNFPHESCSAKRPGSCEDQFRESCSLSSSSLLKYVMQDLKSELL